MIQVPRSYVSRHVMFLEYIPYFSLPIVSGVPLSKGLNYIDTFPNDSILPFTNDSSLTNGSFVSSDTNGTPIINVLLLMCLMFILMHHNPPLTIAGNL